MSFFMLCESDGLTCVSVSSHALIVPIGYLFLGLPISRNLNNKNTEAFT